MAFNWNRKRIDADAEDSRSRGQGGIYVGLKDGEFIRGRFLPVSDPRRSKQEVELYVRYGQHYMRDIELYLTCLYEKVVADWIPKEWKCPHCELNKELRGSRDADDQEEAKKYNPSVRFLSNFRLEAGEVKAFRYSVKTQPKLVELAFGTEYADILDLTDGRDVEIKRKGAGLDTDYIITPLKKTYTIAESVLDQLHDLYAEIRILPPDKMAQVLKGSEPGDGDFVSLRELMGGGKGSVTRAVSPPGRGAEEPKKGTEEPKKGSVVAKRREPEPEPELAKEDADENGDRKPTKGEAKMLTKFGDELGLEIDMDNTVNDITDALVTEAVGTPKKKLSAEFLEFLELNGCDVSGSSSKLVEKLVPRKVEKADEPAAEGADGGDADQTAIREQIQRIRDKRNKK